MNILVYIYIMFSTLYLIIVLMDIFSDTVGILNSVVSHTCSYYEMLRGQIGMYNVFQNGHRIVKSVH